MNKRLSSKVIVLLIGILSSIFFCYPYLNHLDISGHDLGYHLTRIQQIALQIKSFNIPFFIHTELVGGLGYGNSLFYPELFLYIPSFFNAIGISIISSYKIFIIILTFITYLLMYITVKKISNKTSVGIISSLLYTFSLYRIVDIYTRAALGEVLAFTFMPLILLGLYELVYGDEKKYWVLPIGVLCVINSHIISFGVAIGFILLFLLLNIVRIFKDKARLKKVIISGVLSIFLSLSVMCPILEQAKSNDYKVFTNGTSEKLSTKSLLITQIFMNEYKALKCRTNEVVNDQMNFGNGILLLVLPLFIFITKWNNDKERKFIWSILICGIIILFMTTILFPWQFFNIFNFIQLPWRFNIVITLCFSLVGAYCFYYSISNKELIYILAIFIVLTTSNYLDKVTYLDTRTNDIQYQEIGQGEYLPSVYDGQTNLDLYDIDNKDIKYEYQKEKGKITFKLTDEKNSKKLSIPLLYYKGYKAYINGKEKLSVSMNTDGRILLNNDNLKTGDVTIKYEMTLIQIISYIMSYGTLIVLLLLQLIKKGNKS